MTFRGTETNFFNVEANETLARTMGQNIATAPNDAIVYVIFLKVGQIEGSKSGRGIPKHVKMILTPIVQL